MVEYSQFHDEPIIMRCLERVGVRWRSCCEFGALDGLLYSNTAYLIRELGWTGTFIEIDAEKSARCIEAYKAYSATTVITAAVTTRTVNSLVPNDLDFLSIDIDGNDLWVWRALESRPGLICIEYNERSASRPNDVSYCRHAEDHGYGATEQSLRDVAAEKQYEYLDRDSGCNLFFGAKERLRA